MDFKQKEEKSNESLNALINKCWEDETFKQELIANPVKTIEKLSSKSLDLKGKKIVVTDQTDTSTFYINIPVNTNDIELSDAELEAVAGGTEYEILWSLICSEK